MELQKAAKIT